MFSITEKKKHFKLLIENLQTNFLVDFCFSLYREYDVYVSTCGWSFNFFEENYTFHSTFEAKLSKKVSISVLKNASKQ